MRMRIMALGVLSAGVCFAFSALAAEGDAKGPEGHGKGKGRPDPAARFAAADTNGDGVLSLDEFKAMHAKRLEMMKARPGGAGEGERPKMPSPEEIFKKLDTDGNGSLTKEELAAGHKRARDRRGDKAPECAPKPAEGAQ